MAENAPPGWYHADSDPPGTERHWDGTQWSGETRTASPPSNAKASIAGRVLASPWRRIGARLIDGLITAVVWAPLIVGELLSQIDLDSFADGATPEISISASRMIAATAFAAAYEVLFTAWRGATPGKMAVGIEIVRERDGASRLGFGAAIVRWIPNAVGWLNDSIGLLVNVASVVLLFGHPQRRTINDLLAKTYVVDKER